MKACALLFPVCSILFTLLAFSCNIGTGSSSLSLSSSSSPAITVTFDSQGATTPAVPPSLTVVPPATATGSLPSDPAKTDSVFLGWFTGPNGAGTQFTASTSVTASLTVYACWSNVFSAGLQFTLTNSGADYAVSKGTCTDTSIVIPDTYNGKKVVLVVNNGFSGHTLASISLSSNLTNIGHFAFSGCSNLSAITFPTSLVSIGGASFQGSGLKDVAIPFRVSDILSLAFGDCRFLTNFTVVSSNAFFTSAGGVLFNSNMTVLVSYPSGKTGDYNIPSGIHSITIYSFYRASSPATLTVPITVSNLVGYAFYGYTGLTNAVLPSGLTNMDPCVFMDCSNMRSLSLYPLSAPSTLSGVFQNVTNCALHIRPGTAGYKTALPWTNAAVFSTIIEDLP